MHFVGWADGSILEAASWRLASELSRRHPTTTRLARVHPGGGQYDCLLLRSVTDLGKVYLNRNGTIQVDERFDGRPADRPPTDWDTYFRADPREFLRDLEADAGLPAPSTVPAATARTLTLRVLAELVATAVKSTKPLEVVPGYVDTSGYGGGPNRDAFAAFGSIPAELTRPRDDDLYGEPGYRFWFLYRSGEPILAFEQNAGLAWTRKHSTPVDVTGLYTESRRHVTVTALKLLRRVEQV